MASTWEGLRLSLPRIYRLGLLAFIHGRSNIRPLGLDLPLSHLSDSRDGGQLLPCSQRIC